MKFWATTLVVATLGGVGVASILSNLPSHYYRSEWITLYSQHPVITMLLLFIFGFLLTAGFLGIASGKR